MYRIEQRDDELIGTTAAIRYHCWFDRAAEHLLRVRMEIDLQPNADNIRLTLPSWAPGSYKIRDFISHVGNLHAYDENGCDLPIEWVAKNSFRLDTAGASHIAVEYVFYANERTVRTMHITRWRAFLFPVNCLFYVEGRTDEIHHVLLYYDSSQWRTLTTALSPVQPLDTATMPVILGALNYDILADSPTEIGNHQSATFYACGARHDVALIAPVPLNVEWLAARCRTIVETEASMFGGTVPYDRYVFFVYAGANLNGGLEHARCSVNMCDVSALTDPTKAKSLLALLCHEYFHVWNIKRIRPAEYGPFDYTREVLSPMLWLAEGFTSYYDDLFAYRAGFYSREEYLDILARDQIGRLLHIPGRHAMTIRDSSYLAWVKLYAQSPDGQNRFPSYYLKGGVLALLLDLAIIAETDGVRRLDDVMLTLWQKYRQSPERGLTETDVLSAIEQHSSQRVRDQFWQWLTQVDDPDMVAILSPLGLEFVTDSAMSTELLPPERWAGMQLKSDSGKLIVASVEDATPASRAGIAVDDEIIALNDVRVTTPEQAQLLLRTAMGSVTVTASCDGRLYRTQIELRLATQYRLQCIATPGSQQYLLFERWLERSIEG